MKKIWLAAFLIPSALAADPTPPPELADEVAGSTVPANPTPEPPAPLRIVHPPEGMRIPFVKSSFVYGSADPAGRLLINGQDVKIYPGGGFISMVDYTPGSFTITGDLTTRTGSFAVQRHVQVSGPPGTFPTSPVTVVAVAPDQDMDLRPGESVVVSAQGSVGMEAYFQVGSEKTHRPMAEGAKGSYRGVFVLGSEEKLGGVKITLREPKNGKHSTAEAAGKLARFPDSLPFVIEVTSDIAILRAAPAPFPGEKAGYIGFPPVGTRFQATGRRGGEYRVRLTDRREAWIGLEEVRVMPNGTPAPRTLAGAVSVDAEGRHTIVRLSLGQKVPFEVLPSEDGNFVDVTFFGAAGNTDWVHYNAPNGAVQRVEWFQDESDVYRLRIFTLPGRWWGYDARYEGSMFVLELRRPLLNVKSPASLEGLRIVVDAGHSTDTGARGPTGLLEKDANLAIAQCLEKKLHGEKAEVEMIRVGSENVALYDRPKLAWAARGDILISVHNNALPEGANPFERNGYGVYYYHSHSFELAREVHAAYGELFGPGQTLRKTRLRDDGLHYGNLALPRTPQMPAVLTESAYVIWPPEEALLKSETFQCDCAEAMIRGLKRYVRKIRERDRSER